MNMLMQLGSTFLSTIADVLPIALSIFVFQVLVLKQKVPHLKKVILGFVYVLIGLAFFLEGLELALFPLGRLMAQQLTDPAFILGTEATLEAIKQMGWWDYRWVYLFAFAIGFSTTIAEPSLLAYLTKSKSSI